MNVNCMKRESPIIRQKIVLVLAASKRDWDQWADRNVTERLKSDGRSVWTKDNRFIWATRIEHMLGIRVDSVIETELFTERDDANDMRVFSHTILDPFIHSHKR